MTEIMLFPLSSIVLPEGKMRLRIFEARYKRLVVEAMKNDGEFGICLFEKPLNVGDSELSSVGTLVKIVDFERLEDGLLGITVTGIKRFTLSRVRVEHDGLRVAKVVWLPNWEMKVFNKESEVLSLQLQRVYQQFPQLNELYGQKFFDDASWVSQRWLEILPLSNKQFDNLALELDCKVALDFLNDALNSSGSSDPLATN
ncbi:LON peptidase substrate-binding domain-containing protein [Vibrio atypicus]|uniref:LON peptidase substrate-binding domain-containing protein n=1 Tax=Vibrio atypicus TaxID=558271 RepID=UPI00135A308C|nr:LON peptidase substrate-binding domain-containing protein [Vibrio atypicus]